MNAAKVNPPLIAVVGPTASGKSAWALDLAERLDGEIVGADSRQVYRHLDIGTAKPTGADRARAPHHCIDHIDPRECHHLGQFRREATAAIVAIRARGRQPLLVGGTGQYVWAMLEGWDVPEVPPDPAFRADLEARALQEGAEALHVELASIDSAAAARILPRNIRRVIRALEVYRTTGKPISSWHSTRAPLDAIILAPAFDPIDLDARIDTRVAAMFDTGLVEEVQALLNGTARVALSPDAPGLESIGYREVVRHLQGAMDRAEALEAVRAATRKLARRQRAWFRQEDARIHWCATLEEACAALPSS